MSPRRRNSDSLKRREASVELRAKVLIVCEGAKTEPNYFKGLRRDLALSAVEVDVCGEDCGSAAKSVVEHAVDKIAGQKISDPYDEVWCVFDVEVPKPDPTLAQALTLAATNGINVALSNPCFEYWYVLHFDKRAPLFQKNADVVKMLEGDLPDYAKGNKNVYDQLKDRTDRAIKQAKQVIVEKCYGTNLSNCNPSTHVHLVVEYLRKISKKRKYPKPS
jgi:hypothetical protein